MADFLHNNQYENELEWTLNQFFSNQMRPLCYEKVLDTNVEYYFSKEPTPFEKIKNVKFKPIKIGGVWATENFDCAWFHVAAKLPKDLDRTNLYIQFSNDGESLLVDKDGHAIKGFTDGSTWAMFDYRTFKHYYPIDEFVDEDGNFEAYFDGASNSLSGEFTKGRLIASFIVRRNPQMFDLYHDCDVLDDFAESLELNSEERNHIIFELEKIRNLVMYKDPNFYEKGKAIVNQLFAESYGKDYSNVSTTAVGHAHLDLAWLWPLRESYRKAKRTFANQIYLFNTYPEYHFVVSQPQQLEWIKNQDPKLFDQLKQFEKSGQLEIIGGGWVENDTNIPSEESLVRQELYGQMFYKEEFGHFVNVRWLPDTFGYSAAIPQILKQSRQDYFMTIKISWSNKTIFPYNTFNWEGIDGSKVVVHMPPEGNYNSPASPGVAIKAVKNIKPTDPQDRYLSVFGMGDGGAGPSSLHVERNLRLSKIKTMPRLTMGSASEFYKELDGSKLPTYKGEMYLEKHRGTYTSQSNNKNFNRQFENMMGTYENLLSGLRLSGDKELIDRMWKEALLYQFHDILPGSSIQRVYNETDKAYKVLLNNIKKLIKELGYSLTPRATSKLINLGNKNIYKTVKVGNGYNVYSGDSNVIEPKRLLGVKSNNPPQFIGKNFAVVFNKEGFLEVHLPQNDSVVLKDINKLRVFIDIGDAWDFVDDYRDQPAVYMTLDKEEVTHYGADLLEVKQYFSFKESKLVQTIVLDYFGKIIDIHHSVDWKNPGYMVRAEFENLGFYSDVVHSDIQFGYLDRPTTDDTEHNAAQFEICAQKWFDLSSDKLGIAIINNAKSGFMAKNGIISLNLFRATSFPCVDAEIKHIEYSYAIYPHEGGFDPIELDMIADSYNYVPVFDGQEISIPSVDNNQVQITAFKPAYNGSGYILRMFERSGKPCNVRLNLNGYTLVEETNLLEERIGSASTEISFTPFQIRTFRLI